MDTNKNNPSIACKVDECKYHANSKEYCTLDKILVGKNDNYATETESTNCESFEVK